jgi:hypothetical protein
MLRISLTGLTKEQVDSIVDLFETEPTLLELINSKLNRDHSPLIKEFDITLGKYVDIKCIEEDNPMFEIDKNDD